MLYDDIDNDQKFFTIFALLILAGAAFAAFNLIGRIVEAQRREIGVGMSLGCAQEVAGTATAPAGASRSPCSARPPAWWSATWWARPWAR